MLHETIQLYPDNKLVTLTTYVLDDSSEMLKGKARPGIIICPGGGYFSCSDREAEPIAMKYASAGYHTFVLRYTIYNDNGMALPDLSKPLPLKEDRIFPRQIRDLAHAMVYVKKHAKKWHLDPDRVAVSGFSAGGHNAALYSTRWNEPVITDLFSAEDQKLLKPAAAILGYPITDYHLLYEDLKKQTNPMDKSFMLASNVAYIGVERPSEEQLAAASAVDHVSSDTPPTFIWTTRGDKLVDPKQSTHFFEALLDHGIPVELHILEEGPHGLSLATQAAAQSKSQIFADAAKWSDLALAWLEKRFALPLPELSDYEELLQRK